MSERTIGVLGLGRLGRAVASVATSAGTQVLGWNRGEVDKLPEGVERLDQASEVVERCRLVFFALPAPAFGEVVQAVGDAARGDHFWVHGTKGTDAEGRLVHEIVRQHTCVLQLGALGGPLLARELAKRGPTGIVAASPYNCVIDALTAALVTGGQRLHRNNDLTGVELAGALRNVISIAAGMSDGLGESARSAVLARGLIETARLGSALGARPTTFVGLAGVGDLIARREAASSRNFQLGERAARGEDVAEVLDELGEIEGVVTARALATRAAQLDVDLPLTSGVARVLDGVQPCGEMIKQLLATDPGLGAGDSLV